MNLNCKTRACLPVIVLLLFLTAPAPAQYNPIPLTTNSYTYQIVVPAGWNAPFITAANVTMDTPGIGNTGNTWYEIGANNSLTTTTNTGIPHAGAVFSSISASGHKYQMAPSYLTNDVVYLGPYANAPVGTGFTNASFYTGDFFITNPTNFAYVSLLASAGNGPVGVTVTVYHADSSSEVSSISILDWFNTATTNAWSAQGRLVPSTATYNSVSVTGTKLWSTDIALTDTSSPITSVNFAYTSGGRACIFAISGSQDGINYTPMAVTGYDADAIVESTYPLPYNATMDNGTNINSGLAGANTWYEAGWYTPAPTTGFPAHGSTLISTNTGRKYQMAPSYNGPMSILIDTNHQTANITPANPQPYTAFSLLTAGGNISASKTMTNLIILQHADGTSETNFFIGQDWFNDVLPAAYAARGRADFNGTRTINNLNNTPYGNPRLFESQFQMANSQSAVTNILLKFYQSPSVAATTFVVAVSATAGGLPITLAGITPAQNVYAGQTAQFTASLTYGTTPGYQWQKGTPGGNFVNLTDGGNISGSQTGTLTVANASASDVAYYQVTVTNALTTTPVVSLPSPLTLLTSTMTNILVAGDPITDTPSSGTAASLIDGTLAGYLNDGANFGATPFAGPVVVVVTPSLGNTTVSAMRFYASGVTNVDDPADYLLEGSLDGVNYTMISSGSLSIPSSRNATTGGINVTNESLQEVDFANTSGYTTYRVTFQNVNNDSAATSLQLAELQLLGFVTPIPPYIVTQPLASETLLAGATMNVSVKASGPKPLSYQWYYGGNSPISGATNAAYSITNVQPVNDGNYSCTITNVNGAVTSSPMTLTVVPVTSGYVQTIVADHPIGYWRLDEGPDNGSGNDGTVANDYIGGHNGYYTNAVIGVQGYSLFDNDTAASFGYPLTPDSFVANITGVNFSTPSGSGTNFTIEAWVNGGAQDFDGGIVSLGYGGGGEQINLDMGGNDPAHDFRFFIRDASGASHITQATNTTDGNWHHLVGVVNMAATNSSFYVDGQLVSTAAILPTSGILSSTYPLCIGARPSSTATTHNFQFIGTIDEVAVYGYALTASQVLAHYFAADIVPRLTISPTNATAAEGTSASFYSGAYGSPTITFQWYDVTAGSPGTALPGQTSSNLTLTHITSAQSGNSYEVIASNSYGSTTSAPVTLTVISGPPTILVDVLPFYTVFAGSPFSLSVTPGGSAPFTYGWAYNGSPLTDGPRISGSHSNVLTLSPVLLGDSGQYQLFITNAQGVANSSVAFVAVAPVLGFNSDGLGWTLNNNGTGGPAYDVTGATNELTLTDGAGNEARSSFFTFPVYVGAFNASFTYQDVSGGADGAAFVIQNDPRGAAALGGGGGSLGYGGSGVITPSVGFEINLYSTPGIALNADGATIGYIAPGSIIVGGGDPINVAISYAAGVVNISMDDTNAGTTYSTSVSLNIPNAVGTNVAYVGFTGATGGVTSTQRITDFSFTSIVGLTAQTVGGNVVLTWPVGSGGYVLQQTQSLTNPNWLNVTTQPTLANGLTQVVIPPTGGKAFYRLALIVP